jgi:hypothetical protein
LLPERIANGPYGDRVGGAAADREPKSGRQD